MGVVWRVLRCDISGRHIRQTYKGAALRMVLCGMAPNQASLLLTCDCAWSFAGRVRWHVIAWRWIWKQSCFASIRCALTSCQKSMVLVTIGLREPPTRTTRIGIAGLVPYRRFERVIHCLGE